MEYLNSTESYHCVKSVRIRSFSRLYFSVSELNTERYFSPNPRKYGPGKLRMWTLFTQCYNPEVSSTTRESTYVKNKNVMLKISWSTLQSVAFKKYFTMIIALVQSQETALEYVIMAKPLNWVWSLGSHWRCSFKKSCSWNFAKFTGKHLCRSLFNKVSELQSSNFKTILRTFEKYVENLSMTFSDGM